MVGNDGWPVCAAHTETERETQSDLECEAAAPRRVQPQPVPTAAHTAERPTSRRSARSYGSSGGSIAAAELATGDLNLRRATRSCDASPQLAENKRAGASSARSSADDRRHEPAQRSRYSALTARPPPRGITLVGSPSPPCLTRSADAEDTPGYSTVCPAAAADRVRQGGGRSCSVLAPAPVPVDSQVGREELT